jgi:DNA-binding MarR family transcriptional regulator
MDYKANMKELSTLLASAESVYLTIAKENDLSYNALMMLFMLNEDTRLTQKKVCDGLHLPKSSVHTLLTDLMRRRYLILTEGGNKKEKYIAPTESGTLLVAKVVGEAEQIEGNALSSVSERELTLFVKTAQKLTRAMLHEVEQVYGEKN